MDFYCRTSIFHLFWVVAEKLRPQQHCPSKWSGTKAEVGPYGRRDTSETIANVHFKRCQNGPEKPICHNNSWPGTEHHPIDSRFPWQRFCVNKGAKRTIKWCESKAERLLVPYSQMICCTEDLTRSDSQEKKSLRMLIPSEEQAEDNREGVGTHRLFLTRKVQRVLYERNSTSIRRKLIKPLSTTVKL